MRPSRLVVVRLLVAAGLLVLGMPAATTADAAPRCAVDIEQRNAWSAVPGGPGAVAMQDDDPCRLLAVRPNRTTQISNDGGATWTDVGSAPLPPRRLIAAGLDGTTLLLPDGAGLLSTRDRGRSWQSATGITGTVLDVVADERDAATLYAVVRPGTPVAVPAAVPVSVAPGASVWTSHDGGRTFSSLDGTSGLQASAVAPDPGTPGRVWMGVDGPAGGLFMSTDAGVTFVRKAGGAVRSLGVSRLAGGGSEVIAATSAGFLVSRDGGQSVTTASSGTDATALALEWQHPSAFMALSHGQAVRSSNTGGSVRPQTDGLPADCSPTSLVRDRSVPSLFLVACADGRMWRYRSDGTDLSATDSPDGQGSLVPATNLAPSTPMRELRRLKIAHRGSGQDGSLAFDGTLLYYGDAGEPGVLHRQVARTGLDAGDLHTRVPRGIMQVTYDANRHHMFVVDIYTRLWDVDLRTGAATKMFLSRAYGPPASQDGRDEDHAGSAPGTFTYDPATERFLFSRDADNGWQEVDLDGRITHSCFSSNLPQVIRVGGGPGTATIAGIVATGDGQVYVEAEDDMTVLRMDRSCRVVAQFDHPDFSEAGNENDSLACDTTSFPTAAIWMRDAGAGVLVAYEVPGGYCALPSTVTVTSPDGVATGQRGPVCATLRLRSTGAPLAGLPVDILVAGRGIASPVTDAAGHACAMYEPLPKEAGATGKPGRSSIRQPVLAAFLGTPAYRPASARRSVVVSTEQRAPLPPTRPLPPQPLPVVHAVAPVVAVPVVPPAQPPPPPPNLPQSQPIAQSHPGAQPGAQGAPGGAMAPEEEAETAAQGADVAEFRAREDPALVWPTAAIPLSAGLLLGVVVHRRRRASRVVSQWA